MLYRALLKKEISLPVAFSEWKISLQPTSRSPLPGYTFGFFVNLQEQGSLDQRGITGVPITINLYEWDGLTSLLPDDQGRVTVASQNISSCSSILIFNCNMLFN